VTPIPAKPPRLGHAKTAIDPRYVEAHAGNPGAKLTIVVGIEDEDAERLQQLATAHRQRPGEVISSLLRSV
jgi:hypothetical protein